MKKLLLLLAVIIITSCSSDDPKPKCEITVFGYTSGPNSDNTATIYTLTYGASTNNNEAYTVNQSTYLYYKNLLDNTAGPICWEGEK